MIAAIAIPFWSSPPGLTIPSQQSCLIMSPHRGVLPSVQRAVSDHIPHVFGRIAKLPARDARTQAKAANADGVVLDVVGKVVIALGHRTDKHADALLRSEVRDVVRHSYYFGVIAKGDFATIHR